MATQAKVTFTALNGDSDLTERALTLHQHLRTVQIGRASKTPSKGLQAAVDNAWFDSPVMSRNHAEISFDNANKVVTLCDIGSMHGTYVNDYQLQPQEPYELSIGDIVVFGAEVKRNADTFPACAFLLGFELLPFKANISYSFPPESDEEDYDISDNEDGVSIESQPRKASEVMNAIDLTRDDSPADSDFECTGETTVEKKIMKVMAGRADDIDYNADSASVAPYAENPPVFVNTDDEDAHFSSDSDDESEVEYGDDARSAAAESSDDQDEQNSEDDNSVQEMDSAAAASEPRNLGYKHSEQVSGLVSIGVNTIAHLYPDLNEAVPLEDTDNESDFGLSDAGAEGIRALFDDGLIDNTENAFYPGEESDSDDMIVCEAPSRSSTDDETNSEPLEHPQRVTFANLPSEPSPELGSSHLHSIFAGPFVGPNEAHKHPILNVRPPSPSDAAMVKTATPSTVLLDYTESVKVHQLPNEYPNLTAQSLGEKTGKHAFFAAREDNRAKVYGGVQPGGKPFLPVWRTVENAPRVINSLAEEKTKLEELRAAETQRAFGEKRERSRIAVAKVRERKRRMEEETKSKQLEASKSVSVTLPEFRPGSTIRLFSSPSYLHDHSQAPKTDRRPSPEPDMTSAVTYNESKASMASANKNSKTSGRSGLSINDIIDGAAGDHTSKSLKRKAGDISEAMENEIRVWASSSSAMEGSTPAHAPEVIREAQSETTTVTPTGEPTQRPTKRLRKIVESVGYVALGGATLFGALVLSAPDFL